MKIPKQAYTLEFKELAVRRVKDGQALSAVAKELGLVEQTLRNWAKAAAAGKRAGAGKAVTPEEMEFSRLRAENLRLKRELEIIKKSGSVLREGCVVRYVWIDAHRQGVALADLCSALEASVSGYRSWKRGGAPDRSG